MTKVGWGTVAEAMVDWEQMVGTPVVTAGCSIHCNPYNCGTKRTYRPNYVCASGTTQHIAEEEMAEVKG